MNWLESSDYDRWREDTREQEFEREMGYDKPVSAREQERQFWDDHYAECRKLAAELEG